jgi:hypothetical protein
MIWLVTIYLFDAMTRHLNDDAINGITLRDYFAAKAMASLFSNTGIVELAGDITAFGKYKTVREAIANKAYQIADAMIAERNK